MTDYYEIDPRRSPSRLLRPLPTKDCRHGERRGSKQWRCQLETGHDGDHDYAYAYTVTTPDPADYGGVFDGFTVTSDTDPGL